MGWGMGMGEQMRACALARRQSGEGLTASDEKFAKGQEHIHQVLVGSVHNPTAAPPLVLVL